MTTQTQDHENGTKASQTATLLLDDLHQLYKSENQVPSAYAYELMTEMGNMKQRLDRLAFALQPREEG
ncbi:MAG: hypothetical protein PHP57_06450 [Sideroxydans sp.]|nr:hypothetical protein [Sideroxydans sp.]